MSTEEKRIEEKKVQVQEDRLEFQKTIGVWMLAIILMLPTFIIGFSEMYLPKYPPKEWFILLCQFSFAVGVLYFFRNEVRYLLRFIPFKTKDD